MGNVGSGLEALLSHIKILREAGDGIEFGSVSCSKPASAIDGTVIPIAGSRQPQFKKKLKSIQYFVLPSIWSIIYRKKKSLFKKILN